MQRRKHKLLKVQKALEEEEKNLVAKKESETVKEKGKSA